MGLGFLFVWTSFCPIPVRRHTRIWGLSPGGTVTISVGCGSESVVKNYPIVPPDQSTPKNMQRVGSEGFLSGRCQRWGPPGRLGPCQRSGPKTPPGLVSNLGLMLASMPRLANCFGCWQLYCSSPCSACGSALTQKSTPPAFLATRFRTPPVLTRPRWLFYFRKKRHNLGGCGSTPCLWSLSPSVAWGHSSLARLHESPGWGQTHGLT